ncbi:Amidohydrolase [uncultured Thiomicrorhabdus sp.]
MFLRLLPTIKSQLYITLLTTGFISGATAAAPLPLIDAHSHYSYADTEAFNPQQIIDILNQNSVAKILITGTPNRGTNQLYQHAPNRIIPFLSVYRTKADKANWMHRLETIQEAKQALKNGIYQGIGELHIFARDQESPVLKELVILAKQHQLPMLIHADAEIIDKVFEIDPNAKILWAHLGTRPETELLQNMLDKYPEQLFIDTSVRDKRFLGSLQTNGPTTNTLQPEWHDFLIKNQDRMLAAVDTFSVNRWRTYHKVVKDIRAWLGALPPEVAEKIAYKNAERFFAIQK